jgi:hypothetical protein
MEAGHMRRVPITLLPLLLVVGALAVPPCAFACSCAQAPSLEVVVSEWGNSVFVGRAGPRTGRQIVFTVERWYAGAGAAPVRTRHQSG